MIMSSDVTNVWQCDHDITLTLTLDPNKENKREKTKKKRKLNKETNIQALHVWHRRCWVLSIIEKDITWVEIEVINDSSRFDI